MGSTESLKQRGGMTRVITIAFKDMLGNVRVGSTMAVPSANFLSFEHKERGLLYSLQHENDSASCLAYGMIAVTIIVSKDMDFRANDEQISRPPSPTSPCL